MFVMWGPELVQIGNDAYAPTLGNKRMQGLPVHTTWAELWDFVSPQFEQIRRTGEPSFARDAEFTPNRRGFLEEAYFTYCYSALHDEGEIAGILETSLETTARVLAERRLATLRALGTASVGAQSVPRACELAIPALEDNPRDIPFALLYLSEPGEKAASLAACTGVIGGSAVAPRTLSTEPGSGAWPIGAVLADGAPVVVDDLPARFHGFHAAAPGLSRPRPESCFRFVWLPTRRRSACLSRASALGSWRTRATTGSSSWWPTRSAPASRRRGRAAANGRGSTGWPSSIVRRPSSFRTSATSSAHR